MSTEGRQIEVSGVVQGIGFRPWVYRLAREIGLTGSVRNDSSGVTIDAFGSRDALDTFLERLTASPPPGAAIRRLAWAPIATEPGETFRIVAGELTAERRVSHLARSRHLRGLRGGNPRPARSTVSLSVHQLHPLRSTLHDRARHPLRARGDHA